MSSRVRFFVEYGGLAGVSAFLMYSLYHQLSSSYWLSALVEKSNELYPLVGHRGNDLRVVGTSEPPLEKQNIGLKVQGPIYSDAEMVVLYRHLKKFVLENGSDLGTRYVNGVRNSMAEAGLDETLVEGARVFCPISVGDGAYIPNRRIFQPGDALRPAQVPPFIRYLANEMKKTHPVSLGALRHVMIEYYPSGTAFSRPRRVPEFAGYDCFILPVRAPKYRETPFVVTLTPSLRSKRNDLGEVSKNSWTNRDWDALLSKGCVLHMHSQARMEWRSSFRPVQWFGSSSNPVAEVFTERLVSLPWWQKAISSVPLLGLGASSAVLERVYASCPQEFKEDKGIIIVTVGFSGAELAPRKLSGMPEGVYFGVRPRDERTKWDDDGKNVWASIEWDEIQSFTDVKDVVMRRIKGIVTRSTFINAVIPESL